LLAEGHPIKLREAVKAFECAGLASEAAQARARLPEVASAFLAACMAERDYNRLTEAILAAEAEGISCADARTQLEALVRGPLSLFPHSYTIIYFFGSINVLCFFKKNNKMKKKLFLFRSFFFF